MKAPLCKVCGVEHWGICSDHGAKGALSQRQELARAVLAEVAARRPKRKPAGQKRRKAVSRKASPRKEATR